MKIINGIKGKLLIFINILLLLVIFFLSVDTYAGYVHLNKTEYQMEIILPNENWEQRIIISDEDEINEFMKLVKRARIDQSKTYYNFNEYRNKGGENWLRIIIRRSILNSELSWVIWSPGKKDTYVTPILNNDNKVFVKGPELMEYVKYLISN